MIPLQKCNNILIVKMSAIGDVVMTTPVVRLLREACPNAHITWAVEDKAVDILKGNPYLDEIIVWRRSNTIADTWAFIADIRKQKFDLAIDLQGLLKSALVCMLSGAKFRLGYSDAREGAALLYTTSLPGKSPRGPRAYVSLLEGVGISSDDLRMDMPIAQSDREYARDLAIQACAGDTHWRGLAALCPSTTWPQKHWTEEGWASLGDALATRHDILPFFLGSKADRPLIDRIRGMMKAPSGDAAGKTSLKEAAALIDLSEIVVAPDTGLLHIALALNKPSMGIFGPTGWAHFAEKPTFKIVAKQPPCAPCLRHPTCEEFDCMRAISHEDILMAAEPWLAESVAR